MNMFQTPINVFQAPADLNKIFDNYPCGHILRSVTDAGFIIREGQYGRTFRLKSTVGNREKYFIFKNIIEDDFRNTEKRHSDLVDIKNTLMEYWTTGWCGRRRRRKTT